MLFCTSLVVGYFTLGSDFVNMNVMKEFTLDYLFRISLMLFNIKGRPDPREVT